MPFNKHLTNNSLMFKYCRGIKGLIFIAYKLNGENQTPQQMV